MKNADKPAHPRPGYELSNLADNERYYHIDGLTKREIFAMAAMQGLLSSMTDKAATGNWTSEADAVAQYSITVADELLKQLES